MDVDAIRKELERIKNASAAHDGNTLHPVSNMCWSATIENRETGKRTDAIYAENPSLDWAIQAIEELLAERER